MEAFRDELYHYGVLGMKWGVRRYQNYDGTYTQRGLKRYREAESNYKGAKQTHKLLKEARKGRLSVRDPKTGELVDIRASKQAIRESRDNLKRSKKELSNQYKRLKQDNLADKGKELYKRGRTITGNSMKYGYAGLGLFGARYVTRILTEGTKYQDIAPNLATLGAAAVESILFAKYYDQNRKLRAYYAH